MGERSINCLADWRRIPVLLGERETSLSWWLEEVQRRTYSNLSRFAIDILPIPAMSAEPERVFSGCWRTIKWQRMRLGVKVVEEGECLKSMLNLALPVCQAFEFEGTENLEAGDGFVPN